ncbi:MAG: aspartyl protease family protein [Candidatus Poribacteria bacterium]|nr:aspartyl protease family protein [Candidatus Poribacteria bacterium]
MRHTTQIELENLYDLVAVKLGVMNAEEVRRLIVTDALVDTGAIDLCLPTSLIERLGITPIETTRARTATGIVERVLYSEVQFTILERTRSIQVTDLPEGSPVLVGHMVLEHLDLCLDIKKGLIYNPAHDGEWITEIL